MRRAVAVIALALALARCEKKTPPVEASIERGPVLLALRDRVPPADAVPLGANRFAKSIEPGLDGEAARREPEFSGYGFTFFSADFRDSGTSLEMKSWDQTTAAERELLSGRHPREVIRTWDCSRRRTPQGACLVFDYMVFGRVPVSARARRAPANPR